MKLFTDEATGYCVELPDWRSPVAFQTRNGEVKFDNFNGRWGHQSRLDSLLQICG